MPAAGARRGDYGYLRDETTGALIAPVDDARYTEVLEKARARLGALPAVTAGAAGWAAMLGFSPSSLSPGR